MKLLQRILKPKKLLNNQSLNLNSPSQKMGDFYEQKALKQLEAQGLTCLEKNFCCKLGEIDLIMQQQQTIVFVEVRYRKQNKFGSALESVTPSKQAKLIRTANLYLTQHQLHNKAACRFDVVTFDNEQFNWIKNAFSS